MHTHFFILMLASILLLPQACKNNGDEKKDPGDSLVLIKKDTSAEKASVPGRPPIINLADTIALKYQVIYIKDSASTSEGMSIKLQNIFTKKLPDYIEKEKLKVDGSPMVWYKTAKSPFFFEAGIPVTKKPATKNKTFLVKSIGGDSAVVAHYFGPYSKTNMAYDVLAEWAKDNNKKKRGIPYEIYVSNPWNPSGQTDPYKMQTDIVFPHN